jgi:hypothetical protein
VCYVFTTNLGAIGQIFMKHCMNQYATEGQPTFVPFQFCAISKTNMETVLASKARATTLCN